MRKTALLIICIAVSGCASLARYEQSKVYQPVKYPGGIWKSAVFQPEDVWFTAADGTRIHGWYVEHPHARAVVLFAHGNAGNVTYNARMLRLLRDRHRLSALVFDYRGFGKSEGSPTEEGVLEDARAARRWLARRTGVPEGDVILMGESLGGGVMVDLAANDGTRGLILLSTFTSLPVVARNVVPILPAGLLMKNRFDSLSKISRYKGPLLQSHGDADKLIPIAQARTLFKAAGGRKRFVTIKGGTHISESKESFHAALDEFLDWLADDGAAREPGSLNRGSDRNEPAAASTHRHRFAQVPRLGG
ncbi:MAG: alpha/beta hydrolase [Planctomycetes bacterium]|nr:alpha/beta hydrolase [Planctomycetota bacterium]